VLAAMGNDPAALKSFQARMRLGEAGINPVDRLKQKVFDSVEETHPGSSIFMCIRIGAASRPLSKKRVQSGKSINLC